MSAARELFRSDLEQLYRQRDFQIRVWQDASDHQFINNHLIERSIALLAPELRGESLDVGCGQRPYLTYFGHLDRQLACDFDGQRGAIDFECAAAKIPLPDASLDSILCTEVLEHTPDPDAVWQEFYRLLRPGGALLLTTPMYWPGHEEPYDFYRYPEFGLRRLATEHGFRILRLIPRGGVWALLGQVTMHVIPQYLRFGWMRRLHNQLFLKLDGARCNPNITMGWALLAIKNSDASASAGVGAESPKTTSPA